MIEPSWFSGVVPSALPLLLQYALKLEKRKDRNTVRAEYKASKIILNQNQPGSKQQAQAAQSRSNSAY
jgi:hypothetical protein